MDHYIDMKPGADDSTNNPTLTVTYVGGSPFPVSTFTPTATKMPSETPTQIPLPTATNVETLNMYFAAWDMDSCVRTVGQPPELMSILTQLVDRQNNIDDQVREVYFRDDLWTAGRYNVVLYRLDENGEPDIQQYACSYERRTGTPPPTHIINSE